MLNNFSRFSITYLFFIFTTSDAEYIHISRFFNMCRCKGRINICRRTSSSIQPPQLNARPTWTCARWRSVSDCLRESMSSSPRLLNPMWRESSFSGFSLRSWTHLSKDPWCSSSTVTTEMKKRNKNEWWWLMCAFILFVGKQRAPLKLIKHRFVKNTDSELGVFDCLGTQALLLNLYQRWMMQRGSLVKN